MTRKRRLTYVYIWFGGLILCLAGTNAGAFWDFGDWFGNNDDDDWRGYPGPVQPYYGYPPYGGGYYSPYYGSPYPGPYGYPYGYGGYPQGQFGESAKQAPPPVPE